ncbi:InlB B-repeat-containing protein [Anaerovoracaceae bacterium 42-11]
MKTNNVVKKSISLLLCFTVVLAYTIGFINPLIADAAVNVGSNPTPKIDIAVNVPADYPGTFLDYKQELTQKLKDQGLDPSLFRITSTAVSIDTSSMNGWQVYDHYHSQSIYNGLVPADQRAMQPYRAADASSMGTPAGANILNYINKTTNKFTNGACIQFNRHIGIYQSESGASNMAFAGYGKPAYSDYMIYPAPSSNTRTFSFNIDASVINTHTLTGFGFWMNAGIKDGKVSGYLLYFDAGAAAGGTGNITIKKVSGVPADSLTNAFTSCGNVAGSNQSFSLGAQKKVRLTVELKKDTVTIQQQAYDASGQLSEVKDVLRNFQIDQFASETLNGLGPWVGYSSHGCSGFSAIVYTDLEMSYEASAFDALKYVQYYQGAEYKYFVNLAGASNNPGIPKDGSKDYLDGINRMNNSEIFYVSNAQDGRVVTDSTYEKNADGSLKVDELGNPILAKDKDGNIIHQGLGSSNGCIATSDDYVSQMAEFIAKNYFEENHFKQAQISSEIPLASFYVKNVADDQQLMTIHLRHLQLSDETVDVNIVDKSKKGTASGADGKLTGYKYAVYDPNGAKVVDTGWVDGVDKIPDYTFTKNSTSGTYVFELTVRDQKGNESKTFQTYLTAYLDDKVPYIEGKNEKKNKATITLTDTGEGIDDDGITFIQDGRGSGVAAYWVTNDANDVPTEDDWKLLGAPVHSYTFDLDVNSTDPIVVWVKDECGNIGSKAVFQPTHVRVEDKDGNPIDDYYVIEEKPIIVLPDDDDVPPSDDDDEYHSGWTTPEGKPITPGTTPDPDDNHEIIIRPDYSKDQAIMVYLANGGTIDGKDRKQFEVTGGASILKKIDDHGDNVIPTREGYTFTGWKLLKSHSAANANNSAYINNASNVEVISTQVAEASKNGGNTDNFVENDYYYLVAQWEVSKYTLKLDPNGGSPGNVRSIENVRYETVLTGADISTDAGTQAIPVTGRGLPTKAGYIFQGWSESKDNDISKIFKFATGISGTPVDAPKMPASDKTVYAVWKADTNKFVVQFNSNGGGKISDHAYLTASAVKYDTFSEPSRPGYDFDGWYYSEDLKDITHEDENGILVWNDGAAKPTAYVGGEAIKVKAAHKFVAMWMPRTDTKYTVDYYVNSGKKNAEGEFIYTKGKTNSYTGTTEATVTVPEEDKLSEIEVNERKYWYDESDERNSKEFLSGKITGSPALSLKLYYKAYYNMNVTANDETMGSVTSAIKQKEGTTPTVSWQAKSGYHVARVVVDGKIRDDLLFAGTYTLEEGIHADHDIKVVFEKGAGGSQKAIYQISTGIKGCADGTCEISPTMNVQQGGEVQLDWTIGKNYKLDKVVLDGTELKDYTSTSLVLKGVQADHELVVHVSKKAELPELPTIGGTQTEGQCTVTVNKYGGTTSWVSPSSTQCKKGETYELQWYAGTEDELYEIHVDGKKISTAGMTGSGVKGDPGKLNVTVRGNVVIDVYFKGNKPEDKVPAFRDPEVEDDYIKVTTQIVGGPGTITGGAVLEKNSDYEVEWTAGSGNTDPDSDDYSYYEVVGVEVNGKEVSKEAESQVLKNLSEDAKVVVKVAPVLHDIGLYKYGAGTISFSKTVFHQQNYKGIYAEPQDGYSITKIVVDGVTILDTQLKKEEPQAQSLQPAESQTDKTAEDAENGGVQMMSLAETEDGEEQISEPAPQADAEPAEPTEPAEKYEVKVDAEAISDVNAKTDLNLSESQVTRSRFDMSVEGAISDHVVQVYFTKDPADGEEGEVTPAPKDNEVYLISAKTVGYAGDNSFFRGTGIFEKGASSILSWTNPSGYTLTDVEVNNTAAPLDTMMRFDNISGNQDVVVTFKKSDTNKPPMQGDYKTEAFYITTKLVGGPGTITPSMTAMENDSKKIEWSVTQLEDQEYVVKSVTVNGEQRKDLVNLSELTLLVDQDYEIVVTIKKKGSDFIPPIVDIDTDGDGEPDINKDTDGDGIPDVDIDTDDDGKPDVNVDTDGDGKPDINKDTDGDGKPDVDIDTDDDGKPDINKDTDGDGKPDVDVDTDGDGKPDINKDTDGDGKPDVDIDTDDDGKPDVNVDTDGDGKPDINKDTDGDGKPDVDIDTDGDGKPDVNVDTDGDGVPDINIDTDGDGKPDVNIDTDGDGKPDENVKKPEELPGWTDNQGNNGNKDKTDKANGVKTDELPWWIPTTGDQNSLVLWISLMGAALLAVSGLVWTRIRRKSLKEDK